MRLTFQAEEEGATMPIPDAYPVAGKGSRSSLEELVDRIHRGEAAAIEELREVIAKGIGFFLSRELGEADLKARVELTFRVVVQSLQRPEAVLAGGLMAQVVEAIRAQVTAHGGEQPQRDASPRKMLAFRRQLESMRDILHALSPREREILTRFYLEEQTERQVCEQMGLTIPKFRRLKSRAAARFVSASGEKRDDASSKSA
ncbi:MAG: sigma-70 family RNA polymerase sigma factor [Acidobacteriota bacterium]|nr:sigma-70 family RNA polymerase sigma factor [Acidobacteriota bacterium]